MKSIIIRHTDTQEEEVIQVPHDLIAPSPELSAWIDERLSLSAGSWEYVNHVNKEEALADSQGIPGEIPYVPETDADA